MHSFYKEKIVLYAISASCRITIVYIITFDYDLNERQEQPHHDYIIFNLKENSSAIKSLSIPWIIFSRQVYENWPKTIADQKRREVKIEWRYMGIGYLYGLLDAGEEWAFFYCQKNQIDQL
jgi:hypothetical protein